MSNEQIKILHIINGLGRGGAENMLLKLLQENRVASSWDSTVVAAISNGALAPKIRETGTNLIELGAAGIASFPKTLWHLKKITKAQHFDVVQGWMYHGNLAASYSVASSSDTKLAWNIRHSLEDIRLEKPITRLIIKLGKQASKRPHAIIYNSMKSRQQHEEFGFCGSRSHVIANGFDTHRFRPEPSKREELLKKLKLGPEATIFGTIARYHPMKNHLGLLRAAKEVLRRQQGCHFIFAGRNVDGNNKELVSLIRELGIEEHIHLQGELEDSAELIPALDAVIVPSSYGEGFPNIIGEAMSSAVPVITTDIGDSCSIVGDCGIVSRTSDPNDLAEAIVKFLTSGSISRDQLGTLSRKKVEEKFGIGLIFKKYDHLYRSLISESSKERSQDNTPTSD